MTNDSGPDLVKDNISLVYYLARKKHNRNKSRDFDKLVSDGFLGLIDAAERFDKSKNCKFATFAVPRINGAMSTSHPERKKIELDDQFDANLIPSHEAIDNTVLRIEVKERLEIELRKLSETEQKIIVAYYYSDLTVKEIAKALHLSDTWVSTLHTRTLKKLQKRLRHFSDYV